MRRPLRPADRRAAGGSEVGLRRLRAAEFPERDDGAAAVVVRPAHAGGAATRIWREHLDAAPRSADRGWELFDPEKVPMDDSDWLLRALDGGERYLHLDAALVRRRIHDANLSARRMSPRGTHLMARTLHESPATSPWSRRDAMNAIDVVVPAFNAARYLDEALASVLSQDHAAHRIIVIDDGSTDGTADVAARFGAPVEIMRRRQRRGSRSAQCRNRAIDGGLRRLPRC